MRYLQNKQHWETNKNINQKEQRLNQKDETGNPKF